MLVLNVSITLLVMRLKVGKANRDDPMIVRADKITNRTAFRPPASLATKALGLSVVDSKSSPAKQRVAGLGGAS
jgi:hypothetical protein